MKSKHYNVISFDTKLDQDMDAFLCAMTAILAGVTFARLGFRTRTNFVNRKGADSVMTVYDAFNKAAVEE